MSTAKVDRTVLWACLAAIAVRAAMFWFVDPRFDQGDASSYLIAAKNIIHLGTFSYEVTEPFTPTAYRAPLYPAYLAALLAVAGENVTLARCLAVLVSLLNVLLVARIVKNVAPQARTLAVWFVALNPFDAVYATTLLSESIASTLLLGALAALSSSKKPLWLIVAGVCLGLLCLDKDVFIPLMPFGAVLWVTFAKEFSLGERVRQAALVCVVSGLVVIPYTVRNWVHFSKFIPVSAGRLGQSLWMGSWAITGADLAPATNGLTYVDKAYQSPDEIPLVEAAAKGIPNSDGAFRELFNSRMRNEPLKVIGRWFVRAPLLWFGTRFDIFQLHEPTFPRGSPQWTVAKLVLFGINAVLTLLALGGAVVAIHKRAPVMWLAVAPVATAMIFFPLNGFENRYSMPVYDTLMILAAYAAAVLVARVRREQPNVSPATPANLENLSN